MALKIIGNWRDLRLEGVLAWVHRLVMLITFPIRRFWQIVLGIIIVILLLLIVPLYCGAQFGHIGEWYKSVIPVRIMLKDKNTTIEKVAEKVDEISAKVGEINDTIAEITANAADEQEDAYIIDDEPRFAKWNVGELKTGEYKPKTAVKALQNTANATKNAFAALKQMASATKENTPTEHKETRLMKPRYQQAFTVEPSATPQDVVPQDTFYYEGKLTDYYEQLENRGLVYLDKPRMLYGSANVVGPNSLYVNHTFLFLYGIYTDKQMYDVASAEQYLRDLTADEAVYCAVVAYTGHTNTATGLCFVNGIFINKSMVNHNLARNVGLK